jgi:hypothetical protein
MRSTPFNTPLTSIVSLTSLGLLAAIAALSASAQTSDPAVKQNNTPNPATPVAQAPKKVQAVIAEPATVYAGEPVTLRWYFTGKKVTVSGGRFGKGLVVTGRTSITDKPARTTRYTFDVDYVGQKTNEMTGKTEMKQLHATYTVVAEVAPPLRADFSTYRDRYGWQVTCLKGWKRDPVDFPDPSNNALMYFQPEDDSVERMAVSILPAEQMTAAELMGKAQKSLSSNYEQIQVLSDKETLFAGVPAVLSTFTGMDISHPGTKTQSMLLAFVKNGRAYVVSARTSASQFRLRQPLLDKMVHSFTFTSTTASK